MQLELTIGEKMARLRNDLRMGLPVLVFAKGQPSLIAAAETLNEERLFDLTGSGNAVLAITSRRAKTLATPAYDGDLVRLLLPAATPHGWLRSVCDPADDLDTPIKGPFATQRNGPADVHRLGIELCKKANLLPAVVVLEQSRAMVPENFSSIDLDELPDGIQAVSPLSAIASARVPLEISPQTRLHVFRPQDGGEEHYAIEIGQPSRRSPVLSRLHSACFTGDLLGSLKCDCGAQLHAALSQIATTGSGVLLYLNQEGRGIGLANKMRAYSLQDQGFDTVEANHRLGFEDDERDFRNGAEILRHMGFDRVRLMTNNPKKIEMMRLSGIEVAEHVSLKVGKNPHNEAYLAVKALKSGHML